ncbi:MAG: DUF6066 family protein [Proteobacteria bacterium]|nr:DUF6066 family protein [Cystobacterineae bacterium]MCL2259688.1 DUF6066 family protein [Cystobacterineae bacterium]MCL2313725.1 DUF6066 family protein [Pseudomonadota bacterium]
MKQLSLNQTPFGKLLCTGSLLAFFLCLMASPAKASEGRPEALFNDLKQRASKIDDLSGFLRNYVGYCGESPEAFECRRQAAVFRQQANRETYVFFAFEDSLVLEIRPLSEAQFSIGWLPFFSASGYALSAQPPKKWNTEGLPIYSFMQLLGQLPPDSHMRDVGQWNRFGRLAAEVIFAPQGTWKAAPKGKTPIESVKVTWKAIRIFDSQSGQTLGVWVN